MGSIQNFEIHHYNLIVTTLLLPISGYFLSLRKNKIKNLFILFIVIGFINTFFYKSSLNKTLGILPTIDYFPAYNNTAIFYKLSNYLIGRKDIQKIYFSSDCYFYNTSTLEYFTCSLQKGNSYNKLCNKIADSAYLISRDPFPIDFINSNYLLTVYPKNNQQPAIQIFDDFIYENTKIYQKIPIELNDGQYQINLYRKTQELTQTQINHLLDNYINAQKN